MLKISAHISKKVPTPEERFGSQQYGASLELEVSDASKPEEIQDRIRRLYAVISRSIDEQISAASNKSVAGPGPTNGAARHSVASAPANGKANGTRFIPATAAQQRAIHALCKSHNLDVEDVLQGANVASIEGLSIRAASTIIDRLKGNADANAGGVRG